MSPRVQEQLPALPKKPADPTKPHAGGKWTEEEEQLLRDAFVAHTAIEDIAKDHGRTPGAITSRLVKLGLVEDNPANRTGQGRTAEAHPGSSTCRRSTTCGCHSGPRRGCSTATIVHFAQGQGAGEGKGHQSGTRVG